MAYRVVTSKQKASMVTQVNHMVSGRLTFVGPEPDAGCCLMVKSDPHMTEFYEIDREGRVSYPINSGWVNRKAWLEIAGQR